MQRRSKLEQVLEHLVNEEQDKARELLHQYIVEKARGIHEELMSEEDDVLEDEDFDASEAEEEIDGEEMFSTDELGEEGDEDEEGMDVSDEEMSDEEGDEFGGEEESGEDDMEDKIAELEKELEDLRSEFEELQDVESEEHGEDYGDEEAEGEGEGDEDFDFIDGEEAEGEEGEEDEEVNEMEDPNSSEHNINRKARSTSKYGQNAGKAMNTDAELSETEGGASGNANKVSNAGYKKASAMKTDWEDTDHSGGTEEHDSDMYAYDDAGWPGKPMTTEGLSDEWDVFDDLDESVLDDLETVNVKMGGEQGYEKYAGNESNTDSPIPQKDPKDRFRKDSNSRLTSKQDQHSGYDRENAPNNEQVKKYSNVRKSAASDLKDVDKTGDKEAHLNKSHTGNSPQTTSPMGSKGTAGNKGVRGENE